MTKHCGVVTDRSYLIGFTEPVQKLISEYEIPDNSIRIYSDEVPMASESILRYIRISLMRNWNWLKEGL